MVPSIQKSLCFSVIVSVQNSNAISRTFWLHIVEFKTVRARNLGVDSGHFFMRSDTHKMLELSHGVKP